jgi:phospholipid/cholesterol/gamma-HCH transport system substrate-binding protein
MIKTISRIPPRMLGAGAIVLIVLLIAATFSGIYRVPFTGSSRTVVAVFDRAAQLYAGDEVRINGEIDGHVTAVERNPSGAGARVTMALDAAAGPLYADAGARLRIKTLLGGSYYVEIDRGDSTSGPSAGQVIPLRRTSVQVEIEDLTDIFRGGAMQGFKTLATQTATMLADASSPAADIATANRIAPAATAGLRGIRGVRAGYDLPALVHSSAQAIQALDAPTDQLHTLVSGAAATFSVTGARSQDIARTVGALPATATQLISTLSQVDGTLAIADRLVDRLTPVAPSVAPTLAQLRPALVSTNGLLVAAGPLTRTLPPLLTRVRSTSATGVPLVTQLKPALRQLNTTILPYLGAKDLDTGYSTTVMIGGTTAGFGGGSSGQLDENGRFIRFPASIGASSVYLPCTSRLIGTNSTSLLKCDDFNTALQNYLSYLPRFSGGS